MKSILKDPQLLKDEVAERNIFKVLSSLASVTPLSSCSAQPHCPPATPVSDALASGSFHLLLYLLLEVLLQGSLTDSKIKTSKIMALCVSLGLNRYVTRQKRSLCLHGLIWPPYLKTPSFLSPCYFAILFLFYCSFSKEFLVV